MVEALTIGDPVPWFEAHTLAGTQHNLGVMAGRWIALCFVDDLTNPYVIKLLADIIASLGKSFNDEHLVFYAVLTKPTPLSEQLAQASHRGLGFINDEGGSLSKLFGAERSPRLMIIDPLLRMQKLFVLNQEGASSQEVCTYLSEMPSVDDFAGVPLSAPALIIPNVFESEFCSYLIDLHEKNGGKDSGFMLDKDGKTMTVIDHKLKQRTDLVLEDIAVRQAIRERVVRRVVPLMERFFQYRPTRMDRYLVSCYDAQTGGHFSRHRDNVNVGARHRRFAASFNLNADYEGCKLFFPEFGRRLYAAPCGGAIVFSTGALHQVTPVTRGKRYAFVPFFYGEEEAKIRLENNAHLHDEEGKYTGERDELFPKD